MDERLTELESKLAFAEHLVDQLNEVVIAQEARITTLEAIVTKLEEQVRMHGVGEAEHQKPPHY